jgi:RNA polymerase II subunit A small phosphatase-like protein
VALANEPILTSAVHEGRPLLVLDLDETLVHASDVPLADPWDARVANYYVYARPGLRTFLETMGAAYTLGVWTSSSAAYADGIVRTFMEGVALRFVWSARRCTYPQDPYRGTASPVKNLSKLKRLGFRLERIVMLDDTPEKLHRHYGNLVRVRPYFGEPDDDELSRVTAYLLRLATADDVRRLEKRDWRDKKY